MSATPGRITVLGVRHHSPACARLVRSALLVRRPRWVLIEGPADMNTRLDELGLGHELPVAIFTHRWQEGVSHSYWTPFCAHSPEWVALETAAEVGATARFIDLPAWHPAFWGVRNRYADHPGRSDELVAHLCQRFGVPDMDSLWDHLFEQPLADEELERRLQAYFLELRAHQPPDERDEPREAFMARCVAAAVREGGDVLVVCGGWHAPELARLFPESEPTWPVLPEPPTGARVGSYLVPYSFHRLDSFTGYEAGMPSPAYQDELFRHGPERAAESFLAQTIARLRQRRQTVSAADLIAVSATCEGLRRLRGHATPARTDLLDGLAAALVKDALDVPLPWSYRGTIRPRTEPLLVEVMATFSGERVGRLAAGTPRPPLCADVRAELEAHDLEASRPARTVTLDLVRAPDLARSRILHRLRVLRIPGFTRASGPGLATDGALQEAWRLEALLDAEGALIEAGAYGATLSSAAASCLEQALLAANGRLAPLARLLSEATFVDLESLAVRVLDDVARGVGTEPDLGELGSALDILLGLWRHDTLLGAARSPVLARVMAAAFDRGLWLLEGVKGVGAPADPRQLQAVLALRDTFRHGQARLGLSSERTHAVMKRRTLDPGAPQALRGAALGFLWSTGHFETAVAGAEAGAAAVRRAARPETLGDFLAGLFLLAREEALRTPALMAALDVVLAEMSDSDFLRALPALRLACSFFPPAEKEQIARQVLELRRGDTAQAGRLLRLDAAAELIARALALEADVAGHVRRFGLHDEGDA